MNPDILNPVVRVKVRGEDIEVTELNWRDYVRAIKELTGTVFKLVQNGNIVLDKDRIVAALEENETLVAWLVERSTNRDGAWVGSLKAREILPIIDAIIELNLSDEVTTPGKAVGGRMQKIFGLTKASLAPSTT